MKRVLLSYSILHLLYIFIFVQLIKYNEDICYKVDPRAMILQHRQIQWGICCYIYKCLRQYGETRQRNELYIG